VDGLPYGAPAPQQQAAVWNDAVSRLLLAAALLVGCVVLHTLLVLLWHGVTLLHKNFIPLPAWLVFPGEWAGTTCSGCSSSSSSSSCCSTCGTVVARHLVQQAYVQEAQHWHAALHTPPSKGGSADPYAAGIHTTNAAACTLPHHAASDPLPC
jgi:hypothetical protein